MQFWISSKSFNIMREGNKLDRRGTGMKEVLWTTQLCEINFMSKFISFNKTRGPRFILSWRKSPNKHSCWVSILKCNIDESIDTSLAIKHTHTNVSSHLSQILNRTSHSGWQRDSCDLCYSNKIYWFICLFNFIFFTTYCSWFIDYTYDKYVLCCQLIWKQEESLGAQTAFASKQNTENMKKKKRKEIQTWRQSWREQRFSLGVERMDAVRYMKRDSRRQVFYIYIYVDDYISRTREED